MDRRAPVLGFKGLSQLISPVHLSTPDHLREVPLGIAAMPRNGNRLKVLKNLEHKRPMFAIRTYGRRARIQQIWPARVLHTPRELSAA